MNLAPPPPPRFAICYFGVTRSTRYVYKTHHEKLFDVLKQNGAEYDIFLHTWQINTNYVLNYTFDISNDPLECQLLTPNKYKIEEQDEFLASINMDDYFYKHAPPEKEWRPELVRNHICALESLKRSFKLCAAENKKYDYVIFMRPDVRLCEEFPYKQIFAGGFETYEIAIHDGEHWEGYNDRFAITTFNHALYYSHRINEIVEYRKNVNYIVSERYNRYIIDKYYKVKMINFSFKIVRPDGEDSP
jgi:hypothetical protein